MRITRTEATPAIDGSRVFIPSLPTRWDAVSGQRQGVYNLNDAAPFGIIFTLSTDIQDPQEAISAIERGLADYSEKDFILAIGDVSRIIAACLAVKDKGDAVRLLQWDKRRQQYFVTEVSF